MRVKCALCDSVEKIDDWGHTAKRLRNRPIHTFMCDECTERVAKKTKERWDTGKFHIPHRKAKKDDNWW